MIDQPTPRGLPGRYWVVIKGPPISLDDCTKIATDLLSSRVITDIAVSSSGISAIISGVVEANHYVSVTAEYLRQAWPIVRVHLPDWEVEELRIVKLTVKSLED